MARRLPFRGQNPQSKPPYFIHSIAFKSCSLRWARGGGRGFRLPLPTPSGLPTHPNDQGLNPGPKRGSRSVQKPKKHSHACPWKLQRSPNGGTGVFLNGFCPPLRLLSAPALAGAGPVGKPTTTENPRLFLRSGGFIIIFQGVPRTEKQATQNLGLTRAQPGSLIKRLKPYHRLGLVKPTAVSGTR